MFFLKKIIISFLLPPGIFIILILCYGAVCILAKKLWRGFSFFSLGMLAWTLTTSPVADALLKPLEAEFAIPKNPDGDVVILLSLAIKNGMPDMTGTGAPSNQMMDRVVTAVRIQKRLGIPLILSGKGNDRYKNSTQAVLQRFFSDLGVPPDKIIVEDRSRDTRENIKFSSIICREKGFQRPILVTSAYHLKRAMMYCKHEDLNALPFPAGFETWDGKTYSWRSFLPGNFRKSSIALHEHLGLLHYRFVNAAP